MDNISLTLIQSVVDTQKDLIVIFKGDEPILTNKSFNKFFSASSCETYNQSFGAFVDNFVPHPSYFHKEKIEVGETWFEGIAKLPEIDRVVSMMTPDYEPHAFSVILDQTTPDYAIATFSDITQVLIERIMIENNANIDIKSGAFTKKYFLHISQSYQDAALFNKKIIGAIVINIENGDSEEFNIATYAQHFKSSTRQDDMLIRWSNNSFLLICLVDCEKNAQMVVDKLNKMSHSQESTKLEYSLELFIQQKDEGINALIKRIGR